ncbi:STAS domain-containing protein [Streptomyces flavochromogenes]|uniref:STAS domain-containing protein n=1 Tax=Streptomyces flavochromogenes TaxID=68199 RepID=UPI00068F9235|nr:STAS domain-containing protein [Streptomyces flavochromogenes]
MSLLSEVQLEFPADAGQGTRVSVRVQNAQGGPVVSIAGELDLTTAPHLRAVLLKVTAVCPRGCGISLDLSGVTFCDCTGLHVLLSSRQQALGADRPLAITAGSPRVDRLLEITGTAPLFTPAG